MESVEIKRATPQRILLIRLSALGDVLFTLPAVNAIRMHFPAAHLSYLVSKRCAPLIEGFAAVDETIVFDREALRRPHLGSWWRNTVGLALRLRRACFDLVIDFHGFGETAMFAWCSGARERWGCFDKKLRSYGYTVRVPREFLRHPIESNLRFLESCGLSSKGVKNQFHLAPAQRARAAAWFLEHSLMVGEPTIFLQPFTSSPAKNWPLESYLALAHYWRTQKVQVIFGGGPSDRLALGPAAREEFAISAGLELVPTASLMDLCEVVVGGDTGILHLAVALGKRVVMLLNSATGISTVPFDHSDWVVAPAPGTALSDIAVERVIAACQASLTRQGAG